MAFCFGLKENPETLAPTVDSCRPGRQGCEWVTFQGLEPLSQGQGQPGSSHKVHVNIMLASQLYA
jgi:hypothetical protein